MSFRISFSTFVKKAVRGWGDGRVGYLLLCKHEEWSWDPPAPTSILGRCDGRFISPALGRQRQGSLQSKLAGQANFIIKVWGQGRDLAWVHKQGSGWGRHLWSPLVHAPTDTHASAHVKKHTTLHTHTHIEKKVVGHFHSYYIKSIAFGSPVMLTLLTFHFH